MHVHGVLNTRLSQALQASRAVADDSDTIAGDNDGRDVRCVLASILNKLGYTHLNYLSSGDNSKDNGAATGELPSQLQDVLSGTLAAALQLSPESLGLSTADKQVMVLAKHYEILRYDTQNV